MQLTDEQFVQLSLINHLFYLRVMRSFSINIQTSFYQNNQNYIRSARSFQEKCNELGREVLPYANYELLSFALQSNILVTEYTLACEQLTEKLFHLDLATDITKLEKELKPGQGIQIDQELIRSFEQINEKAFTLTENFIAFCQEIATNLKSNSLFSYSYITLYHYMIEEVEQYQKELERLRKRNTTSPIFVLNFEYRFNEVMRDGAMFIRGFVDPIQEEITSKADHFIQEFNLLIKEYGEKELSPDVQKELTKKSLELLTRFTEFIKECMEGRLDARFYFIVEPTFLDTLYAEANYFNYGLSLNRYAEENLEKRE